MPWEPHHEPRTMITLSELLTEYAAELKELRKENNMLKKLLNVRFTKSSESIKQSSDGLKRKVGPKKRFDRSRG